MTEFHLPTIKSRPRQKKKNPRTTQNRPEAITENGIERAMTSKLETIRLVDPEDGKQMEVSTYKIENPEVDDKIKTATDSCVQPENSAKREMSPDGGVKLQDGGEIERSHGGMEREDCNKAGTTHRGMNAWDYNNFVASTNSGIKPETGESRRNPMPHPRARRPGFAVSQPLRPNLPSFVAPDNDARAAFLRQATVNTNRSTSAPTNFQAGFHSSGPDLPGDPKRHVHEGTVWNGQAFAETAENLGEAGKVDYEADLEIFWRSQQPRSVQAAYSPAKAAKGGQNNGRQIHLAPDVQPPSANLPAPIGGADGIRQEYQEWRWLNQGVVCEPRKIPMHGPVAATVALAAAMSLGSDGPAKAGVQLERK